MSYSRLIYSLSAEILIATLIAAIFSIPFIIYFWSMTS